MSSTIGGSTVVERKLPLHIGLQAYAMAREARSTQPEAEPRQVSEIIFARFAMRLRRSGKSSRQARRWCNLSDLTTCPTNFLFTSRRWTQQGSSSVLPQHL